MKARKLSRPLAEALLETAEGRHRVGILDDEAYRKITLLHLGTEPQPAVDPVTSKEIRRMREKANLSQAAFARYLNLTPGYISQLERGIKEPKGPALALLQRDSAEGD